jgi:predicted Zn-dependent protease
MVYLMADLPPGDPREVAAAFLAKLNREFPVEVKEAKPVKIGQIDAWRVRLSGGGSGRGLVASVTFVPYRGTTWRITAVSSSHAAQKYSGRMLNTARSFRPLAPEDWSKIHGLRLHLVTARAGEDLTTLGRRSENAWDPATTAVFNGIFTNHRFDGGELVKVAHSVRYVGMIGR